MLHIFQKILPMMFQVHPDRTGVVFRMCGGAYNVQKAGQIMAQHYTHVTVTHCAAHDVSLIFGEMVKLEPYCDMSKFCKIANDGIFISISETSCLLISLSMITLKLHNMLGSTHHGPRSIFKKCQG